jgi:hypothetical protein
MHFPPLKGLLPKHPRRIYPAVGRCIYCGAVDGLQDEHIIPLGLGGRYVLPKASCRNCGSKTSAFERTCQRTMYGPLRLLYGLPSRRNTHRPETLPLRVKRRADSDWEYIPVLQSKYPFLITFPYLGMPGVMSGKARDKSAVSKRMWIRGASPNNNLHSLCRELIAELGVHTIMPESKADVEALCRMLAKVAYSFAVAECGGTRIDSPLVSYATGGDTTRCLRYIGSCEDAEPPSASLHDLNMVFDPVGKLTVVRVRLLACLGAPTYYVVVDNTEERADMLIQATDEQRGG